MAYRAERFGFSIHALPSVVLGPLIVEHDQCMYQLPKVACHTRRFCFRMARGDILLLFQLSICAKLGIVRIHQKEDYVIHHPLVVNRKLT